MTGTPTLGDLTMNKTQTLLVETKKHIVSRGWIRGLFYDPDSGAVCLLGAIILAEYGIPPTQELGPEDGWNDNWTTEHPDNGGQAAAFAIEDALIAHYGHEDICNYPDHDDGCPCHDMYDCDRVSKWNDNSDTSYDDVLTTIDVAIKNTAPNQI